MRIKCSECNVWFMLSECTETSFYTKCPSCGSFLNVEVEVEIKVSKRETT